MKREQVWRYTCDGCYETRVTDLEWQTFPIHHSRFQRHDDNELIGEGACVLMHEQHLEAEAKCEVERIRLWAAIVAAFAVDPVVQTLLAITAEGMTDVFEARIHNAAEALGAYYGPLRQKCASGGKDLYNACMAAAVKEYEL